MKDWEDVDQGSESDRGENLEEDEGEEGVLPFAFFVLLEASLAPASLLIGWFLGESPLVDLSWDTAAVFTGIAAALPMLIFLAIMLRWPFGPLSRIKGFFDSELAPLLRGCKWTDYLLISIAAGVGEEMLFRGLIQGSLSRFFNPIAGVTIAALLFGLLHPVSITYVVVATLLGAYLGIVWMMSGNLLSVMITHGLYDFIALLILMSHHPASSDVET